MAYHLCEDFLAPGEVLCTPEHCRTFRQTSSFKRVCMCLKADGTRIPGCDPKSGSFPVETTECYNKVTGERRALTADACRELRDTDPDWTFRPCFCCCGGSPGDPRVATGEHAERLWGPPRADADWNDVVADQAAVDAAWAAWRAEVAFGEEWLAAHDDMGLVVTAGHHGDLNVRDVVVHLIEEYAQHLGHADLLRECIDGRTGQ